MAVITARRHKKSAFCRAVPCRSWYKLHGILAYYGTAQLTELSASPLVRTACSAGLGTFFMGTRLGNPCRGAVITVRLGGITASRSPARVGGCGHGTRGAVPWFVLFWPSGTNLAQHWHAARHEQHISFTTNLLCPDEPPPASCCAGTEAHLASKVTINVSLPAQS